MEKTVLFVILEQYADWEAAYLSSAIYMLGRNKFSVKTISLTNNSVQSIGGFLTIPDYNIMSAPAKYEGLILIGGMSWRNEEALQIKPLVQNALENKKILGGICDAAGFLAASGALNNVYHTGNDLNDIKQWAGKAYTGASKYISKQAVRDGNIITANGTAALEFAKEALSALEIAPENKISEWYNFHKLGLYTSPLPNME